MLQSLEQLEEYSTIALYSAMIVYSIAFVFYAVDLANRSGDAVVASGAGGIFSPNIRVARVIRTSRDIAVAQPSANPDALDFALVQATFLPDPTPTPSPRPSASAKPKAEKK